MAGSKDFNILPAQAPGGRSLYERMGGAPAITAVAEHLFGLIVADDRINRWFAHAAETPENGAAYKAKLVALLSQATGGPREYGGDMGSAHKGRGIPMEAFASMMDDIEQTFDHLRVMEPEKSEALTLLRSLAGLVVGS